MQILEPEIDQPSKPTETERLMSGLAKLDAETRFLFVHHLRLIVSARSKSWRTRRWNDFQKWVEAKGYRAADK